MEDGLVDAVLGSLMSGKEAQVFLVRCGDEIRCAKVYKDIAHRSFKNAVQYQEGRSIRNSRRQRAIDKRSKFGRDEQEVVWQRAEVDALYKLADAGVRVPTAYGLFDGVLLMELITDKNGGVAPRLNDITMSAEQAVKDHAQVMTYVLRMLCAGLIHGDLSEFNILQDENGPVIIDFPQVVNASGNNNAKAMLQRDVRNITQFYAQYAPELAETHYAEEMWELHEKSELTPERKLTGRYQFSTKAADLGSVLTMIDLAYEDELDRQNRLEDGGGKPR